MRRQLNTLYVTTEGAWLRKEGANIVMEVAGEIKGRLPAHMLESIVCIGRILVSPPLLGYCAEQGVCVAYLRPCLGQCTVETGAIPTDRLPGRVCRHRAQPLTGQAF